jgi:hypothetical protein
MVRVLLIAGAAASGVVLLSLVVTAITGRRARLPRRSDPRGAMFPRGEQPTAAPDPPAARTPSAAERI